MTDSLIQNLKLKTQYLTDWHCHILPGIDDGPATMDESIEMARGLRLEGYTTVYCTPHLVRGSFEADNAMVTATLVALQAELVQQRIGLRLLPGREYYLDEYLIEYLKDPLPLGDTKYIMIEIPNHMPVAFIKETCYRIKCAGFVPMIAHPERCTLFAVPERQPDGWFDVLGSRFNVFNSKLKTQNSKPADNPLLAYLQEIDCKFQGNLGSFVGRYGETVRTNAERLRAAGLYACFGTDAHSATRCSHKFPIQNEYPPIVNIPVHSGQKNVLGSR